MQKKALVINGKGQVCFVAGMSCLDVRDFLVRLMLIVLDLLGGLVGLLFSKLLESHIEVKSAG